MTQSTHVDQLPIYQKLADEHTIELPQVQAFASLLDEGASVPFIARYRKDKTGGLDDIQLRALEKSLIHERDLQARRNKVLQLLSEQNALTDDLKNRLQNATSKLQIDAIYEPYRPKRRSLSTKASLAGLHKFAERILAGEDLSILSQYTPINTVVIDGETVDVDYSTQELQLAGIQAIILDQWALQLDLFDKIRTDFNALASIHAKLVSEEKREAGEKFHDYFDHTESFSKLSNHRLLAMLRGRQANVLSLSVLGEDTPFIQTIKDNFGITSNDERGQFLADTAKRLWQQKWRPQIEHRLLTERRLEAQTHAIGIFAQNLKHLLMSAPAGRQVILGVDPGIRHGIKMAVIDPMGDVLETSTVYAFDSEEKKLTACQIIADLITKHTVTLVAIGNGTASRETEELIKAVIATNQLSTQTVVISEAGASVYSASELASNELPDLDVSVRGAVSIARRLQDPLSELVKVEPKAIGVGQYQHDVNQNELELSLNKVTEDCVNAVGVDVNTASPAILTHIAGLNKSVAEQIVNYRRTHGAFKTREQLKCVPRLGAKTFEQSAGFLRIKDGPEPLDATGVHPESYELVYNTLKKADKSLSQIIQDPSLINSLGDSREQFSQLSTALAELAKPAHDPRGTFKTANFHKDINHMADLKIGMVLEGVVTNVTAFGCFVDIGVHQDGLVHISELSDEFISDPSQFIKPQDIVHVRVVSVDEARRRIGLSMKKDTKSSDDKAKKDHTKKLNRITPTKSTKKPKPESTKKPSIPQNKDKFTKIGSFGTLLQQAGIKKTT